MRSERTQLPKELSSPASTAFNAERHMNKQMTMESSKMSRGTSRLKRFGEKQGSLRVTVPPEIWKEASWRDGDLVLFETQLDGSVNVKKI